MSDRFVIEDIVTQDWSGVLFQARDLESGGFVGLHRFFPFGLIGVEADGLSPEERSEYLDGVREMADFRHPSFRTVITGECDPVDGVPFLVTEWVEGEPLSAMMESGDLPAEAAFELFNEALTLCEALSLKLGSEALWVSMLPDLIVRDSGRDSRGFTFAISPNRWLVDTRTRRSLKPMANLLDRAMGWNGRIVGDHMGGGLGGWLKWLRGPGQNSGLEEARHALERFTGRNPEARLAEMGSRPGATAAQARVLPPLPSPSGTAAPSLPPLPDRPAAAVVQPATFAAEAPRPQGRGLWVVMALLVLAIGGVLAWVAMRPAAESASTPQNAGAQRPLSRSDLASRRAAELSEATGGKEAIDISELDEISAHKGSEITVSGEVSAITPSNSGKTLFVEFKNSLVRGQVTLSKAEGGLTEEALREFEGGQIHLTGVIQILADKPVVNFTSLDAVQRKP